MAIIEQIKQFQTGSISVTSVTKTVVPGIPITGSKLSGNLLNSISQLSSKSNEISSFLNDASINGGNGPFSLTTFAREFIDKQNKSDDGQTSQVTDSKPITRKIDQITQKVVDSISQNYIKSNKLLSLLDTQVNSILKQSNVTYVTIENGQIQAQPIQNKEVEQAIKNVQQIINTYVNAVDKYARRIYNTDPIKTLDQLQKNLSLNHVIEFTETVIAVALLILQIKIKIRKSQDAAAAVNALATAPPQPLVAARFAQMALENTASEQKQLDDLAAAQQRIVAIKKKIDFYGKKYEKSKNKLLDLQGTINVYQSQLINKTLSEVNNQLTGSYNQLTGSLEKKLN
jgi:hypothetical protein